MVWCALGVGLFGVVPPSHLWHGVGSGFLAVVHPCVFGSALGVWYTHPYDDNDDDGDIMNSNILLFLWLVVGCLLSMGQVTIIALLIVVPPSS